MKRRGSLNHIAFEVALSEPWMMLEDDLRLLLAIANREAEKRQPGDPGWEPGKHEPRSLALIDGRPLDDTEGGWVRDGVAVVPIMGPIFRRANLFTELSGATSLEVVARDITVAVRDPTVRAVVLEIDSPGGQAAGIGELASHLYAWRGEKPIVAFVGNQAASAAYYLAAAASEVVLAPMALVGSIGVVSAVQVDDPAAKKRWVEFVSSQSPNKRPDPTTERGRSEFQAIVDTLAEVMILDIARYRDTDPEAVVSDFGAGGMKVGADAIGRGMADRLGTLEGLLAELSRAGRDGRTPSPARPARVAAIGPPTSHQSPAGTPPVAGAGPTTESESEVPMPSWKDSKAAVMGLPDDFDPAAAATPTTAATAAEPPPKPTPPPPPPAARDGDDLTPVGRELEDLRRQVEALTDQNAAILGRLGTTDAAALKRQVEGTIQALVLGRTAYSAEQAPMRAVYLQAARDDRERPLANADGTPAPSRLELLSAWQDVRPQHNLFEPAVAGELPEGARILGARANPADPRDESAPANQANVAKLMDMTPLGKAALELKARRNGTGNGAA